MRSDPFRSARLVVVTLAALGAAGAASAHDLFFRAPRYVVELGSQVVVDVLNGTFSRSENGIARDRLAGLSVAGPAGTRDLPHEDWTGDDPKSTVKLTVREAGIHVLGAAVKPRLLKLSGREFEAYLEEEGLDHVVAARAAAKRTDEPSRERYAKYLKALFQVGEPANAAPPALGHEAEIVPEQNPYALGPGGRLTVRCLVLGQPWAGGTLFAGGRRGSGDERFPQQRLVTDKDGRATVALTGAGIYYVKLVAIRDVQEVEANYESRWATLSFAVGPTKR